ncbi:MAG: DUF3619 family protein [Betaproteobacteria bacterium]
MNEERFAHRIRQGLNRNLDEISPTALRRLQAARHFALEHHKQPTFGLALAGGSATHSLGDFLHNNRARQAMAIVALLVGMATALYWQGHQYVSDLEDVDSALLSDSLPPEAFLDKGFAAWLDDSSEE